MLKKYYKEFLICFSLIVGFICGWFGCKSYIRYQSIQISGERTKQFEEETTNYCDSLSGEPTIDTTIICPF